MRKTLLASAMTAGVIAAVPGVAPAAPVTLKPVLDTLTAPAAVARSCDDDLGSSLLGVAKTSYVAPMSGYVTVRGSAPSTSDWDLAVFDAASGRRIGASQGFGSNEVVQTWVTAGQRLAIQACRRHGDAATFDVATTLVDVAPPKPDGISQLIKVTVRSSADLARIEKAGLDLTHDMHGNTAVVRVTGAKQLGALKALGLKMKVLDHDLDASDRSARAADARAAGPSALPSGRTEYRKYEDYQAELKKLAEQNPGLVRPVTLPKQTFQGRDITGLEIAKNVDAKDDGRATYMIVGEHHAREWPSSEAAIEFAYYLINGYTSGDPRVRKVVEGQRNVIVPIINVDGFIESRNATDPADTIGEPLLQTPEGVAPPGGSLAYRRKNCDGAIPSGSVPCTIQYGVDNNRNYTNGWGGNGAGTDPWTQSYRGPSPGSEPETQAVHDFSQNRAIANIISIHTVAALVLRPPGRHFDGKAPDEVALKNLGDEMAKATGYTSQYSFQLYDTSGTTEDWNYAQQGAYGYTIEMGPVGGQFHGPYATNVVQQWTGRRGTKTDGKGMREALLLGAEAALNPASHAILTGTATPGRVLHLHKDIQVQTSPVCGYAQGYLNSGNPVGDQLACVAPGEVRTIADKLDVKTVVPASGKFTWHVNQSTRPFVGWKFDDKAGSVPTGKTEAFKLTCEVGGKVLSTQSVVIGRGQTKAVKPGC